MIRKILQVTDPRLRQKSKPVGKVDKKILRLIADMEETIVAQKDPEGVGLAAPQIGEFVQVFVLRHKGKLLPFINPEIVKKSKETNEPPKEQEEGEYIMEGCLSLPHYYGPVERSLSVELKYGTPKKLATGDWRLEITTKSFTGFPAQMVQHEIDHLNGTIFVDRLLRQKRQLYKLHGEHWHEVELP